MSLSPDEPHVLEHARFLHRLVRSIVLDESTIGDVAQETWLVGQTRPPPPSFNLGGWLSRVARRIASRMRRSTQRRSAREQAVAPREAIDATVDVVSREELLRLVTQTVLALDEPYRSAVMQRYYEDLTPEEIARRCDTPVATIKSRLHRARLKLRERLAAKLELDLREALGWIGGIGGIPGAAATAGSTKLLVGVGLVVATGAAWWIGAAVLPRRATPSQENASAAPPAQANAAARAAQVPSSVAKRDAEPTDSGQTPAAGDDEFRGRGSIALKIVDVASGAAIADLPFIVYSERPRIHVFKRAVTDVDGAATIGALPNDVILFETGRRPPLANTVFATWLKAGEEKRVEMRLTRGGTVQGRVVDDAGAPIEGVEVAVDPRPGGSTLANLNSVQGDDPAVLARFAEKYEPVTKSDASGRYEVASLLARPTAIWIEHQAMSPKRQEGAILTFRWQLTGAQLSATTGEGETSRVDDVVLERVRRFAGRVLGADGTPVGGALVSTRIERMFRLGERAFDAPFVDERPGALGEIPEGAAFRFDLGPWEDGFALARDEAITSGDGSFEVTNSRNWYRLFVASRAGARKNFDLPVVPPGSFIQGLELRLPVQTQFELEITEADGSPVPKRSPDGAPIQLRAFVVTRDEREHEVELLRAGPTSFGVSFDVAPAAVAELVVTSRDHVAAVHRFATPPLGRTRVVFALERKPSFELPFHFHFADEADRALLADVPLRLIARTRPGSSSTSEVESRDGAGIFDSHDFQPKMALTLTFRVPSRRKWFVSLRGPFQQDSAAFGEVDLGAFTPDGTTHEVEIPKVSATWLDSAERKQQEEAKDAGAIWKLPQGFARFVFVDATTQAPIDVAKVRDEFVRVGEAPDAAPPKLWCSTSGGVGAKSWPFLQASPGHYTVKVALHGYRDSAPFSFDIVEKETTEVGTVLLEPWPERRVRLVQRDGTPVGAGWQLELFTPATLRGGFSFYGFEIATDANGVAAIRREWPEGSLLMAWPPNGRGLSGPELAARYELAPWPVEETRDLVVPPMRRATIVLDLASIDSDLRDAHCTVYARFADGLQSGHAIGGQAGESSAQIGERRRFTFTAPPGRYVVDAEGQLFSAPKTTIELADVDAPQEFTLVAAPR